MSSIKIISNASAKFFGKTLVSSSGGGGGGGPVGPVETTIYDSQGNVLVTDGNPLTGDIPQNWKANADISGYVEIGTSATSIGDYAFSNNLNITSVTIPNSVTSIGAGAFFFVLGLDSVTIPNSVTTIGESAFYNTGLQSVTIPNSVTSIANYTFAYCSSMTSVIIPDSVTTIGNQAFQACPLDSVTLGNSVETIGDWCFLNHSLTSLTIPDSVTSIGSGAFYGDFVTALTDVYCYTTQSAFVGSMAFYGTTGPLTLHVRASDNTWTAGSTSFQDHFDVTIVKDL